MNVQEQHGKHVSKFATVSRGIKTGEKCREEFVVLNKNILEYENSEAVRS